MKCNFKWLSLYMDGELSQRKRARLEEHLRVCESCEQILEQLKSMENMAGRENLPQISEAYWENFSVRVGNKLLLREKDSASHFSVGRIKRLFQISPFRLKLAAGLASILIVVWVGKIYMDYKKVPLPFEVRQNVPADLPEGDTDFQPSDTLGTKIDNPEPVGTVDKDLKSNVVKSEKRSVKTAAVHDRVKESVKESQPSSGKQTGIMLPTEEATAERTIVDKHETQNLRRVSAPLAPAVPDTSQAIDVEYEPPLSSIPQKEAAGEWQALMVARELAPLDSLRFQIQEQEKLISGRPADSILEMAYIDLAQKHLQLCQLTKSKEDIAAARARIHELLNKYLLAPTRISLNQIIQKLRELEKSRE